VALAVSFAGRDMCIGPITNHCLRIGRGKLSTRPLIKIGIESMKIGDQATDQEFGLAGTATIAFRRRESLDRYRVHDLQLWTRSKSNSNMRLRRLQMNDIFHIWRRAD
jgi:hypothetical protein